MTYAISLSALALFFAYCWRMRTPAHEFDATRMSESWRKARIK
jgi:hypothetical protein